MHWASGVLFDRHLHVVTFMENQACHSKGCPSPPIFHLGVLLLDIFQDLLNLFTQKYFGCFKIPWLINTVLCPHPYILYTQFLTGTDIPKLVQFLGTNQTGNSFELVGLIPGARSKSVNGNERR